MKRTNHGAQEPKSAGNRRTHERVPARVPISAISGEQIVQIEASNISEGGAYCLSSAPFTVMTRMSVSIELPDPYGETDPLQLDAVVVRSEPHLLYPGRWNLALFFPILDEASRDRIASFVRARRAAEQRGDVVTERSDG